MGAQEVQYEANRWRAVTYTYSLKLMGCCCFPRSIMTSNVRHQLSSAHALHQTGLKKIEYCINQQALRWIGHVARVPESRPPRRLFFSGAKGSRETIESEGLFLSFFYMR